MEAHISLELKKAHRSKLKDLSLDKLLGFDLNEIWAPRYFQRLLLTFYVLLLGKLFLFTGCSYIKIELRGRNFMANLLTLVISEKNVEY